MKKANFFDLLLWRLGWLKPVRIEGNSMLPGLKNGDKVLVKKCKTFQVGDIVLANHPYKNSKIIKRIASFSASNKFFLLGDNLSESTDSRTFGEISKKDILGKVICFFE